MAVKIRLKRIGAKKSPSYRIVVADSKSPRNGKVIAQIGHYNPMNHPAEVKIDTEAAKSWLNKGAQPTESVNRLFKNLELN